MSLGLRILWCTGLVLGVLASLTGLRSGWSAADLNLRSLVDSYQAVETSARQNQELAERNEVVCGRIKIKKGLIEDMVAGRLSFLETAAWFKYLSETSPGKRTYLPYAGSTVEEKYCRMVLCWAENHMQDHVATSEEGLLQRLRTELNDLLASPQGLQLPNLME